MSDPLTLLLLACAKSAPIGGRDILLEEIDGVPLIMRMARACGRVGPTRVVLGPGERARAEALDECVASTLPVDLFAVPQTGDIGRTIAAAVAGLDGHRILIQPADMPEISAADLHLIVSLHDQGLAPIVQAATHDGTPGHPVIFAPRFHSALAGLSGGTGAHELLTNHAKDVALVPLGGRRKRGELNAPDAWGALRGR